jgi:hypothetical protein
VEVVLGLGRLLPLAMLALAWLVPAAQAEAGLKAKTSLTQKAGKTRIVVKLTSDKSLDSEHRPRGVKVKTGGRSYKLKRVRGGASAAAVNVGTWRSDAYGGTVAEELLAAAGEKVTVRVRSLSGTTRLHPKLIAPKGADDPPGDGPPTGGAPPTGDDPPPADPGDITGQPAIDQMTAELRGGFVRDVSSSGSTVWEFHMCETGDARYYSQTSDPSVGVLAVEKFGNPWTVTDAIVRQDGSKAAIVEVVMTFKHNESGEQEEINEPFRTRIEYVSGQWYWEGEAASTGQASCDPTF